MNAPNSKVNKLTGFYAREVLLNLMRFVLQALGNVWLRFGGFISAFAIIGYFALMLGIDLLRPSHNWDTLAYLGVVARDWLGMSDPALIHAFAFDSVRAAISPEQFVILTENDAYRERMLADPQAFNSMLGMYDVKWLYIALLAALAPIFGTYGAGFAINVLAAALLCASSIVWLRSVNLLRFGIIVPALLMMGGVAGFAMVDIPDLLTLAFMMSAIFALDRNRQIIGFGLLVLAVATRPDAVVFTGVLMAAAWLWRDRLSLGAALAFIAAATVYFAIKAVGTHPGWWTHFWFSTYHIQNDLTDFTPAFDIKVYIIGLCWNLVRSALENTWLGIYALTLGGWALMHASGLKLGKHRTVLVGALLGAIAVKFFIFPLHDSRVHLPFLLPAILILVAGFRDALLPKKVI